MKLMNFLSLSSIWGKVWPVLIAILFFGLIIFIHELGHFIFAKLFKVKVNEFALGMGPTLIKKKKNDTTYALRLFPIGGFVAMEGEDEDSEVEGSFSSKPVWQRMIITAAGATFNLILGLIICSILLSTSDLIATPVIRNFYETSVSNSENGLREKDRILKVDGTKVYSASYDLSYLMQRSGDNKFDFTVLRDGEKVELKDVEFATKTGEDGRQTIIYDFSIVGIVPTFKNVLSYTFSEAVSIGRMVYMSLFDLCTGHYRLSDLSGPVGTVQIIAEVASESVSRFDFSFLLQIMALITINIGLFNVLPIPALDGGRLFFMFIELIFRKPVPQKYERWIHAAGMVLLLLFMAVISFNDILKLIQGKTYI